MSPSGVQNWKMFFHPKPAGDIPSKRCFFVCLGNVSSDVIFGYMFSDEYSEQRMAMFTTFEGGVNEQLVGLCALTTDLSEIFCLQ